MGGWVKILAGKPILRGTRIPVELLLEILANGWNYEEIFENYPQIGTVDILAALHCAADRRRNTYIPYRRR